jgi:hypothetical protein
MFDGSPYKDELRQRILSIRHILDAGDPSIQVSSSVDISREVRGLAILLLFATYENLIKSICRGILERASTLRVGNRRLKTGFRQFAVHNIIVSIANTPERKLWVSRTRELLEVLNETKKCTIDPQIFPRDENYMRRSQVKLVFDLFELGDPGILLKETWDRLDTIVTQRNQIAHGELTPQEIGRRYTNSEIRDLVNKWEARWNDVIDHISTAASNRNFYRY